MQPHLAGANGEKGMEVLASERVRLKSLCQGKDDEMKSKFSTFLGCTLWTWKHVIMCGSQAQAKLSDVVFCQSVVRIRIGNIRGMQSLYKTEGFIDSRF